VIGQKQRILKDYPNKLCGLPTAMQEVFPVYLPEENFIQDDIISYTEAGDL
jgi:hypothetical protein